MKVIDERNEDLFSHRFVWSLIHIDDVIESGVPGSILDWVTEDKGGEQGRAEHSQHFYKVLNVKWDSSMSMSFAFFMLYGCIVDIPDHRTDYKMECVNISGKTRDW